MDGKNEHARQDLRPDEALVLEEAPEQNSLSLTDEARVDDDGIFPHKTGYFRIDADLSNNVSEEVEEREEQQTREEDDDEGLVAVGGVELVVLCSKGLCSKSLEAITETDQNGLAKHIGRSDGEAHPR